MRRVLDDRNPQRIMISQVAHFAEPFAKALDLLNVVNLKDLAAVTPGLEQQRNEHGPVGVRVDAAAGAAAGEGGEEEGRALGGLVGGRRAQVGALLEGGLLVFEGEDVDVGWFHEFLLDARGGEVDEIAV